MINAAPQCDLIELRLDTLGKTPDLPEMLEGVDKPVLISCRRPQDGGQWRGTEEERLALLRMAIIANPAYVELELDIAGKVPRFGKTQRVISYTKLDRPLGNVEPIYEKAVQAKADYVKFVGPTPNLDAAWPLLAAVTKKRQVPVVGVGLGKPGLTFSLLGRKYGAPWVYAALERGMEGYLGQPTIQELEDVYRFREIGPGTKFIAVTGFGEGDLALAKALNAAFAETQVPVRCLPIQIGKMDNFAKMMDGLKISTIIPNAMSSEQLLPLVAEPDEAVQTAKHADFLVKTAEGWQAHNLIWKSVLRAVEGALGGKTADDRPLDRRNVLILGAGALGRSVAYGVQRRKGLISVTAAKDKQAQELSQTFNARFVPIANLYNTLCDVVLITEAKAMFEERDGVKLNPSYLREHMMVADISNLPADTELLREARGRGCKAIPPADIFAGLFGAIYQAVTGKRLSSEIVHQVLPQLKPETAGNDEE